MRPRGVFRGLNGRECIGRSIVLKTKEREKNQYSHGRVEHVSIECTVLHVARLGVRFQETCVVCNI